MIINLMFDEMVNLDLDKIEPSVAGPKTTTRQNFC